MVPDTFARIIWNYLRLNQELEKADGIVVLGSHDTRVAERGAELFLEHWAPWILFSGYLGAFTRHIWSRPEAEMFADIAIDMGVPRDKILIENQSTNTGENVKFSKRLLTGNGFFPKKIIAVQKPYMERRTFATFKQHWPELEVITTSPRLDFDNYPNKEIAKEDVIHILVGDLQRILLYPEKGWQIPQEVPHQVLEAYQHLIRMGYTGRIFQN